ncbi:MAG: TlpA family protein disulfide reductase [Cytophagaceae bacterium]|nr:MAG: TlpA family protein disulfide reductase [Cytophagaceae bacterium]
MKNVSILCLLLFGLCLSANAQPVHYVLIGQVLNVDSLQTITLTSFSNSQAQTVPITQRQFVITGTVPYPSLALVGSDKVRAGLGVWLANDTIRASFTVRQYPEGYQLLQPEVVSGPRESVDYLYIINTFNSFSSLPISKQEINQRRVDYVSEYVRAHPTTYLSLFLLNTKLSLLGPGITKELFAGMSDALRQSQLGQQLVNQIENLETNELGKSVANFSLPDTDGVLVSLNNTRKRNYTLVNFWASDCAPCRVHNQELVKLHQKISADTLRMISISLDRDRKNWLSAIKKDGLIWEQLSDLKNWDGPVAKQFAVSSIPQTILLDENNKIIAITTQDVERILSGR